MLPGDHWAEQSSASLTHTVPRIIDDSWSLSGIGLGSNVLSSLEGRSKKVVLEGLQLPPCGPGQPGCHKVGPILSHMVSNIDTKRLMEVVWRPELCCYNSNLKMPLSSLSVQQKLVGETAGVLNQNKGRPKHSNGLDGDKQTETNKLKNNPFKMYLESQLHSLIWIITFNLVCILIVWLLLTNIYLKVRIA